MADLSDLRLVLFFTRGVSLGVWNRIGMFDREVALYRALREHLKGITFVTYGDSTDLKFSDRLPGIEIICNKWKLPRVLYQRLVSRVYSRQWTLPIVVKSNQVDGADVALRAARQCGGTFIVRGGFLHSYFTEREQEGNPRLIRRAVALERKVFSAADRIVVTTQAMRESVIAYGVSESRIVVTPNYVETERFKPMPDVQKNPGRIIFIGRLAEQKNPFSLLDAIDGLNVELFAVGEGPFRQRLIRQAEERNVRAQYVGNRPTSELPEILNSGEMFIFPSLYEGHPKALLEAMACGLPVIGGDSPGIRELITHGENGYLCGTSALEIREAIQTLLADSGLCEKMGRNARDFVARNFSLESVLEAELSGLKACLMGQ